MRASLRPPASVEPPSRHLRLRLWGFVQLIGSGALGALGLSLLASNRWRVLPEPDVARVLLFIQWEALGLTVAKCGLDTVLFAVVTRSPEVEFAIGRTIVRRLAPLAVLVG